MRTEFDNLRLNDKHAFETDSNGDKQVVKIYCGEKLIAKKTTVKKSVRYFGVKEYQDYLSEQT
jgi:hypothetical protein